MSINIDVKKWMKAFFSEPTLEKGFFRSLPIYGSWAAMSYDGEWIKISGTVGTHYVIVTCGTHEANPSTQYPNLALYGCAICKVTTDSDIYIFFFEPQIGSYSEYQGIDCRVGTTHYVRSRNSNVETATNIDPQDWTVERRFAIYHRHNETQVDFEIDGAIVATHTTNISSQPYMICCAEPNAQVRDAFLKYPFGITCGKSWG